MIELTSLPAINACLNGLSAVLLGLGFYFIKAGRKTAHRNCMCAALTSSALFLASYLYSHANAGRTVFVDPAWCRPYYLAILISHTLLAIVMLPMVISTVVYAVKGRDASHRKIAKWTWPIWMYVSVTGVVIYLLLYQIFPQKQAKESVAENQNGVVGASLTEGSTSK